MGGLVKAIVSPIGAILGLGHKKKSDTATSTGLINPLLPLTDDANVAAAKKQNLAMQLARAGRQSTILTSTADDSLGGGF